MPRGEASLLQLRADASTDPRRRRPLIEYLIAFLLHLTGSLFGGQQRGAEFLRGIRFRFPQPDQATLSLYRETLRDVDFQFDAVSNAVVFDPVLLEQPVS